MEEIHYLGEIYYAGQKVSWGKGAVANGTVYLSGVDGIDPKTGKCPSDVETQTRLALDKAKTRLAEAGSDINHVVRLVTYVVGRENLAGYRKARDSWMHDNYRHPSPMYASTLLVVAGLGHPEMVVEIDITAVLPSSPS